MNYLFLYGGISHLSFALLFFKYIKKIVSTRNILLLGHIFIGTTFLIRSFPNYENNYITGIIGHSLILIFFILTTYLDRIKYRVNSKEQIINLICILGQIGMIIHYTSIGIDKEEELICKIINFITSILLVIFYYNIAISQDKKDKILMYPLLMICILYSIFLFQRFIEVKINL
tara:strand:+ start:611 stop:1132 length:522 start_codon:yes stop_codon:yes gene_type:complete